MRRTLPLLLAALLAGCTMPGSPPPTATPPATAEPAVREGGSVAAPVRERPTAAPTAERDAAGDDAYEPDDLQLAAAPIAVGEIQDRTFASAGDEDWLQIEARAGRAYELLTFDLADGVDTVLTLFDAAGNELSSNDDFEGYASRIIYLADDDATLFLRVTAYDLRAPDLGYRVTVRSSDLPAGDAFEPDGSRSAASPLALDEVQERNFRTGEEEDWAAVAVQPGQVYSFRTFDLADGLDTVLTLYDAEGVELARNDDDDGYASQIVYQAEAAATLYLQVTALSLAEPGLGYRLTMGRFEPAAADQFEPDNEIEQAKPLALDDAQRHSFSGPRDADWARVTLQAGQAYRFSIGELSAGLEPTMALYDARENELAYGVYSGGGDEQEIVYAAEADGVLYLRIATGRVSAGDAGYTLAMATIELVAPDGFEPDNSRGEAGPLALDEVQERTLRTTSEEDWVAVVVQAGQAYRFRTFDLADGLDTILTLYDAQGDEIDRNDDADGYASTIFYQADDDATLYLQVTALSTPTRGGSYRLTMEASVPAPPDAFEPDDRREDARPIAAGESQTRSFSRADDQDWLQIAVRAGEVYIIETFDLSDSVDTVIELYDNEGVLIDRNDDFESLASQLTYRPRTNATVYLLITSIGRSTPDDTYSVRIR